MFGAMWFKAREKIFCLAQCDLKRGRKSFALRSLIWAKKKNPSDKYLSKQKKRYRSDYFMYGGITTRILRLQETRRQTRRPYRAP